MVYVENTLQVCSVKLYVKYTWCWFGLRGICSA